MFDKLRNTEAGKRIFAARVIAIIADAVQIGLVPIFAEGAASIINDVLDVAIGITMIALVGWNWAFLPAFAAELIPMADLAPTWTIAVFIATRRKIHHGDTEDTEKNKKLSL